MCFVWVYVFDSIVGEFCVGCVVLGGSLVCDVFLADMVFLFDSWTADTGVWNHGVLLQLGWWNLWGTV